MQSITTKYIPATNFRGSRVKATTASGQSIILSWADNLDTEENHDRAAIALCRKMKWTPCKLVSGSSKVGNVYVIIHAFNHDIDVIEVTP